MFDVKTQKEGKGNFQDDFSNSGAAGVFSAPYSDRGDSDACFDNSVARSLAANGRSPNLHRSADYGLESVDDLLPALTRKP